jgi:hypothetical protein
MRQQEAAAVASGTATKAEIEARGGINTSGYYGDSYNPQTSLTDAEYAAALAKGGGAAVNAALEAKMAKSFPSSGSVTGALLHQAVLQQVVLILKHKLHLDQPMLYYYQSLVGMDLRH